MMPDYQNKYGGGFDQSFGWFFSNWGPSFDKEGPAGWSINMLFTHMIIKWYSMDSL